MKDFYDIWLLSRQFDFDGETLTSAIRMTFTTRGTPIVVRSSAFTGSFADDTTKKTQWKAFLCESRLENAPGKLEEVTSALVSFLMPVTEALIQEEHC